MRTRRRDRVIVAWAAAMLLAAAGWPGRGDVPAVRAATAPVVTPASNLLPGGTGNVEITATSGSAAVCRWGSDPGAPFADLAPFTSGDGTTTHTTSVPVDPDPRVVTTVTVRCDDAPTLAATVRYRALPTAEPGWPRIGNLWGSADFDAAPDAELARIDLWLGARFADERVVHLRTLNPAVRILNDYNFVEWRDDELPHIPDDYYLRDAAGRRFEVWPGAYRVNLTRPEVADWMAEQAYQALVDANLRYDGVFIDNVYLSQAWAKTDMFGRPFHPDADGDGAPDDLSAFDAQWRAGGLRELTRLRELAPSAILMNHSVDIGDAETARFFNGTSIAFDVPDAKERRVTSPGHVMTYAEADARYAAWLDPTGPVPGPRFTMVESAVPAEIGYGYGYEPELGSVPAPTLTFARRFFSYLRFGYGFTLMRDGYFAHEFGDTWHGNRWWYDEMLFDLGSPAGPARPALSVTPAPDLFAGGDMEGARPLSALDLWADTPAGYAATATIETDPAAPEGRNVLRVDVAASTGEAWRVAVQQFGRRLTGGTGYALTFWARSDVERSLDIQAQKGGPDWRNYGLEQSVWVGTSWKQYTVRFTASQDATDAAIGFLAGARTGSVWLDGIHLRATPPDVLRRDFANGAVLLNGTSKAVTVRVGPGFHRIVGGQAPRDQRVVDDVPGVFSTAGTWLPRKLDSGLWKALGPWYHDWGPGMHVSAGTRRSTARWSLGIKATDRYSVSAWWAAAPTARTWSRRAVFEVVSGGRVVARRTVNQRSGGDQWHVIAAGVRLAPGAFVRLRCPAGDRCAADAILLESAHRFNDGAAVSSVTIAPFDAIVLRRDVPLP